MSATRGDKYRCISERQTPYGYWWRYTHAQDEPDDTLKAATMIAVNVAHDKARKPGKTYLVASTPLPMAAVYIFASDHPDACSAGINVMCEFTPAGPPRLRSGVASECIRRPSTRTATRH